MVHTFTLPGSFSQFKLDRLSVQNRMIELLLKDGMREIIIKMSIKTFAKIVNSPLQDIPKRACLEVRIKKDDDDGYGTLILEGKVSFNRLSDEFWLLIKKQIFENERIKDFIKVFQKFSVEKISATLKEEI